jgi:hypothetical protein
MARLRGKVHRLDLLVLGADPAKLKARQESPAANGPRPLSDGEKQTFYALTFRHQFGPALTGEERWKLEELKRRAKATTPAGKGWF